MTITRSLLLLAPIALLAACGDGAGNSSGGSAAAPVAATPAPAGKQWTDVVAVTPEGGYRMGNPDAPIKLVEFGSRTCHVCAAFDAEGSEPLKQRYVSTGKVSYEYRDYLRNPIDIAATLIGECNGPEPFFPLVHQVMAGQEQLLARAEAMPPAVQQQLATLPPQQQFTGWAEAVGLIDWAKQRGIPEAKARQCLGDVAKAEKMVEANGKATEQYGIAGTPTFLLNGEKLEGTTWQVVEGAIKAAGG